MVCVRQDSRGWVDTEGQDSCRPCESLNSVTRLRLLKMPLDSLDTLPFAGIYVDEFMFIQCDYEFCEQVFDQLNFCLFQYSYYRAHDQEVLIQRITSIIISPQIVNITGILNRNLTKISICHMVFLVEICLSFILTHAV